MTFFLTKLLYENDVIEFRKELMSCRDWVDGKHTAVGIDKRNLQLATHGKTYESLSRRISNIIMQNTDTIERNVFPEKVFSILFSRTGTGMFYKSHLDQPYTNLGRRDFSFTIFLNDPTEYEGGELILDIPPQKKAIKLKAGDAVIYPTRYLHEVQEVKSGERLVCVGWIKSYIKNDFEREILADAKHAALYSKLGNQEASSSRLNLAINKLYKHFGN